MTQATVNVGNSAVKNLNPNAQHFSSRDFNHGTVLAGSTAPSDESYSEYHDSGTGSYLRQHQSHHYPIDPTSIEPLQHQQQHQQSDSNFAVHEHAAMLDTIDHQQTQVLNPNHMHHPQQHINQTMPDEEQAHQLQAPSEQLRQHLRKQLEYYFSRENMIHDTYLQSQMDADDYVPISIIAGFKLVKRLTNDIQLIVDVLKELPSVEVDPEEKKVRSAEEKKFRLTRKRCIIILRDVPLDATEVEVQNIFLNENCPVPAVACERVLESGNSDCWYVTFNSEDDAQNAFLYLTRENVSIRGQKVLARMKTRLWQKPSSMPGTSATTPMSPPITTTNSGATSPPPPLQQQQQQAPMQTYPNSSFVAQQQQPQQAPPPPPQYSSHPQQQQFNQQQIPPPQQQHAHVYMPTAANTHPNQTSLIGNIQPQTSNYRHPIHSSVAPPPPPPQHVAAQYQTTNQSQHPSQMDPTQVLQLRMSYPNYGANTPFDRTTWATAHPQSVQTGQPTLSFATTAQQANMASYTGPIHQQTPLFAANHHVFPAGNLWYVPSGYSTTDAYPTMAYNGANKSKTRMPREYTQTSKPRNSTKPTGTRNPRHEGLQMNNEHSNELLDYCQHSTPHSEDSSSPVPRAEVVINRTNEPIAQPVSNTSLQHVQAYPTSSIDTSTNETIDHYHHQSNNDILYNNTNSHVQQQGSSDINQSQEQTNDSQTLGNFSLQSSYPTSTTNENSNLNYQPLEQRKPPSNHQDQQPHPQINENQQQQQQQPQPQQSNKKFNQQQSSIRPLMSRENRSTQNSNRPSSSQQGRSQQQQQQQQHQTRNNSNSATPLSVAIPKVTSATYYNQASSSSPQSPNSNPKNQQQQQQQPIIDNSGPRTYADMLKLKQAPQQQQPTDSTRSPTNETNDITSPRAQSPTSNTTRTDSVSANVETNGPLSPTSSDISPSNQIEPATTSQQSSTINDSNSARRNSSASDHPQQQQQQQQQQHTSSPSHQQYNNPRGRGGGGRGGGNYRYSHERRSGSNNSLNRGGNGGGGGSGSRGGGGRRTVNNNNNSGSNGPPSYQSRGGGGGRGGNGRFFDRSRGGGGNYHNSNQSVHRFTGNTGNVESQVHYAE